MPLRLLGSYPSALEQRQAKNHLKPADVTNEEAGKKTLTLLRTHGFGDKVKLIIVVTEPHKRYNKSSTQRELHKHILIHMDGPFAWNPLQRAFHSLGYKGHFTFNRQGLGVNIAYLLESSAKKLVSDIDKNPWSYPAKTAEQLLEMAKKTPANQLAKNGLPLPEPREKKRQRLTFSEVTDAFVEAKVLDKISATKN